MKRYVVRKLVEVGVLAIFFWILYCSSLCSILWCCYSLLFSFEFCFAFIYRPSRILDACQNLLFSFEFCPTEYVSFAHLAVIDTCYFLLNFVCDSGCNRPLPARGWTCYFLLNFVKTVLRHRAARRRAILPCYFLLNFVRIMEISRVHGKYPYLAIFFWILSVTSSSSS